MRPERSVRKAIRTTQNWFPALKPAKDRLYRVSRRMLRRPHERDFRALAILPGSDRPLLDIGANQGQSIASIRLMLPGARIVAFEPNVTLAAMLSQRHRNHTRVEVRNVGLGDQDGAFILYTPVYNGFVYDGLASIDRESATTWLNAETLYRFRESKLEIREETCKVETLDGQGLDPWFIKIDVQGLELDVLRGGMATLERYQPVLLVERSASDPEIDALLHPLGYSPFSFDGHGFVPDGIGSNRFHLPSTVQLQLGLTAA